MAHMFHITVGKSSKKCYPWEWCTLMTDTFWFHICWNVETVTWPLWYYMIYWTLTPVANVFRESRGALLWEWIVSINSLFRHTTNAGSFHILLNFPRDICSCFRTFFTCYIFVFFNTAQATVDYCILKTINIWSNFPISVT